MSGGGDWIGFPVVTSAQCQRRMHMRRLARQVIVLFSTHKKVKGASNE